ncbi:MAG: T9SS type A sorting domain-containing protein [Bacteroidota bacterium]
MKTHYFSISKNWRQFRFLSAKLNRLLKNGQFGMLDKPEQQKLLDRLKKLFASLNGMIPRIRVKKALGAAAFLLGLAFSNSTTAQSFAPQVVNPFGFAASNFVIPSMVDIDDDGDLDMFVANYDQVTFEYSLKFVENIGTPDSPDFTGQPLVDNPFGASLQVLDSTYAVMLDFADLDNDGDQDLLMSGYGGNEEGALVFFENLGTASQPDFGAPVTNPFGFQPTYYTAFISLVDIDNDGDFDLFATEYYANVQFYENVGTPESASFDSPVENPFNVNSSFGLTYSFIDLADLDGDGDQDLIRTDLGYFATNFRYQENIGTAEMPDFGPIQDTPFGVEPAATLLIPHAADMDSDGDQDIYFASANVFYAQFNLLYYENISPVTTNDLLKQSSLVLGPNPTTDYLSLQSEIIHENAPVELVLINVKGELIERQSLQSTGNFIQWEKNMKEYPAGTYFIHLESTGHFGIIPFEKI